MRKSLLAMLLFVAPHGLAERALVVGSFADPTNAAAEASRLRQGSTMSFQVVPGDKAGRPLYRVIVPLSDQPAADIKKRLQPLGVQGSWTIDVPVAKAVPAQMGQSTTMTRQPVAIGTPVEDQQTIVRSAPQTSVRASPEAAQPEDFGDVKTVRLDSFSKDVSILVPQRAESDVSINIDGRVDESIWAQLPGYDNMLVMNPDTLEQPRY